MRLQNVLVFGNTPGTRLRRAVEREGATPVHEYSLETAATKRSVPPKRILAERLLRSVKARSAADQAPQVQLRTVEARSVTASRYCVISHTTSSLPRLSAFRLEGCGLRPRDVAEKLKRAARTNLSRRHLARDMSERLATSGQRSVTARQFVCVSFVERTRRHQVQ